jgi:hypothetical protein
MVQDAKAPGAPIEGATICVLHHPEIACATSDANGSYTMELPDLGGANIAVQASAQGYLGEVTLLLGPAHTSLGEETSWVSNLLYSDAEATTLLATQAGFTYPDSGTGFLQIRVNGATEGFTGATVSIAPMAGGSLSAKGPVYWDTNGPNLSLTATAMPAGATTFGDIAPGLYKVTVTAPQKTCTVAPGGHPELGNWQPTGSETTDVEVAAGAYTQDINVTCL